MTAYVRRPYEVEAIRYRYGAAETATFLEGFLFTESYVSARIRIDLGGTYCAASEGDWLVKSHNFITVMEDENFRRAFMPKEAA